MKATNMNAVFWESLAEDRSKWSEALTRHLKTGEAAPMEAAAEKRVCRKESSNSNYAKGTA